jgi:hypothetical protein
MATTIRSVFGCLTLFLVCGWSAAIADPHVPPGKCLDLARYPLLLSSSNVGGTGALAVDGSIAYLADRDKGLQVIDVTNPRVPRVIAALASNGEALNGWDVALGNQVVYLCLGTDEVAIVDVHEPDSPTVIGHITTVRLRDVETLGDFVYVVSQEKLEVYNVADPRNPWRTWVVDGGLGIQKVDIDGTRGLISTAEKGLVRLDVTYPATPVPASNLNDDRGSRYFLVDGNYAYASLGSELVILDVKDRWSTRKVSQLSEDHDVTAIGKFGDTLLVGEGYEGVRIVDVSDPMAPRDLSRLTSAVATYKGIEVRGTTAYISTFLTGFQIYDLAHLQRQPVLGHAEAEIDGRRMAKRRIVAEGNLIYATGWPSLQVYESLGSGGLLYRGGLDDPNNSSWNVAVRGHLAYVANSYSGLVIADVTRPERTRELGRFMVRDVWDHSQRVFDVALSGSTALIVTPDLGGRLYALDVSKPDQPVEISNLSVPSAVTLDVLEGFAYVGAAGMTIVDVRDPHAMSVVSTIDLPLGAWDITVQGEYAYAAERSPLEGRPIPLTIVDVGDPARPRIVSSIELPGGCEQIAAVEDRIYVAMHYGGVAVIDVSEPESPKMEGLLDQYHEGPWGAGVAVHGNRVYTATEYGDMWSWPRPCSPSRTVLPSELEPVRPSRGPRLLVTSSNPASSGFSFRYEVGLAGSVAVSVYDVRGRRVRGLTAVSAQRGPLAVEWDGRDERGHRVTAGTYFVRVRDSQGSSVQKVVLLR